MHIACKMIDIFNCRTYLTSNRKLFTYHKICAHNFFMQKLNYTQLILFRTKFIWFNLQHMFIDRGRLHVLTFCTYTQIFRSNPAVSYPHDISTSSHVVVANSVKHYHLYGNVTEDLENIMINDPLHEMIATNSNYRAYLPRIHR